MIFTNDIYINIVVIVLMIFGGIGFFVIEDLVQCIKEKSFIHLSFHTKIVLVTTVVIDLCSILFIKITEPNLTILQVLFTTSTARTTGFSTIPMETTTPLTKVVLSILMMIGGAPGSTSGGIRITSIAVLVLTVHSTLKNKKNVTAFYRRIDEQTIKQAITNIVIGNLIILIAVLVLTKIQNMELVKILFMCVSAFSATGLTVTNVGSLTIISQAILMVLMFIGRVGPISIVSLFIINKNENKKIEYVSGNLML